MVAIGAAADTHSPVVLGVVIPVVMVVIVGLTTAMIFGAYPGSGCAATNCSATAARWPSSVSSGSSWA